MKNLFHSEFYSGALFDVENWSGFDPVALYMYIYGKPAKFEFKNGTFVEINRVLLPKKVDESLKKYEVFTQSNYYKQTKSILLDRDSESLIIYNGADNLCLFTSQEEFYSKFSKDIAACTKVYREKSGAKVKLIYRNGGSYSTSEFVLPKIRLKLEENYNDDLLPIHEKILEFLRLKKNDGRGRLVAIHGDPGTGKTSYLKWAIQKYRLDNVIFITPEILVNFASTEFTSFLTRHRDYIFIVEDAEKIVVSRDENIVSPVAHILQLTDGFLGEAFNIKLIMSFNKEIDSIDSALLRKGRMRLQYKFNKLSVEKSNLKLKSLGVDTIVNQEMALSDLYNFKWENGKVNKEEKHVGFGNV